MCVSDVGMAGGWTTVVCAHVTPPYTTHWTTVCAHVTRRYTPCNTSNRKEEMRAPNAMYGWVNIVRPRRLGEEKGDMR